MPDHVFRNDGGRFVDVSDQAGVREADRDGRGLGVVIVDLDDDGRPDIYVANDMTANFLFHNLGGFRFEEVGESAGVASGGEGGYRAGMGIACGDFNGDGRPDLAVTNFYGESTSLFVNLGGGLFADRRRPPDWQRPPATSSASAPPSSTPTTTAGSTWRRRTGTSSTFAPKYLTPCPASSCSATASAGSSTCQSAPGARGSRPAWRAASP